MKTNAKQICAKVQPMLGSFPSPDIGEHEQQRADDDSLKDLPVLTEVRHPGHQQLAAEHHEAGHHGHGETPTRQTQLNPWQSE